jgi:hypothetical protein
MGAASYFLTTQDATYQFALTDASNIVYHTSVTGHTYTVQSATNVAFPTPSIIAIVNGAGAGNVVISPFSGVTIRLAGSSLSGSKNLIANGVATITKVATDTWYLTGVGIGS